MYGIFRHIRDVVNNALRDESFLNKRNEAIVKCYNVSKPTVCERNAAHYKIFAETMYA